MIHRTKKIIQIALNSELDMFVIRDMLKEYFEGQIEKGNVSNHVGIKVIEYTEIKDHLTYFEGKDNGSGCSDFVYNNNKPLEQVY